MSEINLAMTMSMYKRIMTSIKMAHYCCNSVVRGYHVCKDVWEASHGELLNCTRETENTFDPFAVYVKTWMHIGPRAKNFSPICLLFSWHGGTIQCMVTGSRQYLHDLPQGRLKIPCQLIFEGDSKYIYKVKKTMSMNKKTKIQV